MGNLVVARYLNGEVAKGVTMNFDTKEDHFHVVPESDRYGEGKRVEFADLKALFFVKTLAGDPFHLDRQDFKYAREYGRKVRVVFTDREEVTGMVMPPRKGQMGMMIYPSDPGSNNQRVFVLYHALERLIFLGPPTGHFLKAAPNAWEAPFKGARFQVVEDYSLAE